MVEATIDMNLTENHEYMIKPSFDEKLTGKILSCNITVARCGEIATFKCMYMTNYLFGLLTSF